MTAPDIARETTDESRDQLAHMHSSWDRHTPDTGCRFACGRVRQSPKNGVSLGRDIPFDACPSCMEFSIFSGGLVCGGPP